MASDSSVERGKLLAELRENEHKLIRAAGYGKDLLGKNERLKQELQVLQRDSAGLEKALQLDFQKSLSETKRVAEQHITELEVELEACHRSLELEKAAANSARELRRSHKKLVEENTELKRRLTQVEEEHASEMQHLNKRKQEIDNLKGLISDDYNQTKRSLQQLQDENQTMEQDLSSMHRSNEKLSTELEDTKDAANSWEDKYLDQEKLLESRRRELDETKQLLEGLQLELDQKYLPGAMASPVSTSSNISLYDELSQADDMEQCSEGKTGDLAYFSDSEAYPYISDDEKVLTLRPRHRACEAVPSSYQMEGRREAESTCKRCQELEEHEKEQETELKNVNKLLLLAVQQKLKLQQQIDCWESDMAQVFCQKLADHEHFADHKNRPSGLAIHFIRNSAMNIDWLC